MLKRVSFAVISLALITGLLSNVVSAISTVPDTSADYISIDGVKYYPGQEIAGERGRNHRVIYQGNGVYQAEFVGSPEFTKSGDDWVEYVFTDMDDHYQLQHPWSSVKFYDYYTEVWNEEFTEVKIYDDRWAVEYWDKNKWKETSFWNITRTYEIVSDGIKLKRTGDTVIGHREEIYYFRDGSPCKIEIQQTCNKEQTVRFVWKPSGIVADTEHSIVEDFGEHKGKVSGLNYYDDDGSFFITMRWYDELDICPDITSVCEVHAHGRKATVTFGEFNVSAGGIAILDPQTFYPDAHEETSSVDGRVLRQESGAGVLWATLHDDVDGTHQNDALDEYPLVGLDAGTDTDRWRSISRGFFLFNTSALPDDAVLTAAVLSVYGSATWTEDGLSCTPDICIYSSNPASNTGLAIEDYDQVGAVDFSNVITYGNWVTNDYNDFTLNADPGRAAISKTGISKFGARNKNYDAADGAPAWVGGLVKSRIGCYFAEKGAGYKPKLVVTYIVPPTVTTQAATSIGRTSATYNGSITDTGGENCGYRGFVWDTSSHGDPGDTAPGDSDYSDNWTEVGSFSTGAFTLTPTLTQSTTYYYRSFAHNNAGWSYGGEESFITLGHPLITTVAATSILEISATLNGNITYTSGVDVDTRGYVWDTASQGDPGNSAPGASGYSNDWTESGTFGTGSFDHIITGLTGGQTYYFRACAQNSYDWNYGDELSFTALELVCYFDFSEYLSSSTIDDQSTKNNDGTATFRTTSSSANVTAEMMSFEPMEEAKAPAFVLTVTTPFITSTPDITGNFTTVMAPTFPGKAVIDAISEASSTPAQLPYTIIAGFLIIAASLTVSWMMRKYGSGSLIVKIFVIVAIMGVLVAVKMLDFWIIVIFVIIALALAMASRHAGW